MRKIRIFVLLALAAFVIPTIGAVPNVQDQTLEDQIRKEILSLPYYGVFDIIGFEVQGDTVVLSGKLYNGLNRKSAEKRIAKLPGVANVINNIELLPPSPFDDRIRAQAYRSISRTGGVYRYLIGPRPSVRIIVEGGNLTLEGTVANQSDIRLLKIVSQGVPGVFSVTDNLKVSEKKR